MDTIELKFLLKLLGRWLPAPLSKFNQTARLRHQTEKGFVVNYVLAGGWNVPTNNKTCPPGKALLLDSDGLPVTDKELKVLRASEKEKITPGKTNVPAGLRQAIIRVWQIGVWLRPKSKKSGSVLRTGYLLRDDYSPKGSQQSTWICWTITTAFAEIPECRDTAFNISTKWGFAASAGIWKSAQWWAILETIRDLDRQMNTEN